MKNVDRYKDGLINSPSDEELRERFVREWMERNRPVFAFLRKATKEGLIDLVLFRIASGIYDQKKHGGPPVLMPISVGKAIHEKSPEEAKRIVEAWRDAEIADAGEDIRRAAEVAELAGMALDRIKTRKYQIFKKHPDGRREGAKANRDKADEAKEKWMPVISKKRKDHPTKSKRWIFGYIEKEIKEGIHDAIKSYWRGYGTVKDWIPPREKN